MAAMPKKVIVEDDEDDLSEEELSGKLADSTAGVLAKPRITMGEVAKVLGKSRATIRRYVDRGLLVPAETNSAGVKFFDTTAVESFRTSGILDDSSEEETQNVAAQAMISLVKEGLNHARQSAMLYFGPTQTAFTHLHNIIERQTARIKELEDRETQTAALLRELQDQKLERDLAIQEAQTKAEHKSMAIKEALKTLPWLAAAVSEKLGMSPLNANVMKFLSVLDKDKLRLLLSEEMNVLSVEERAALAELLKSAGIETEPSAPTQAAE